MTPKELLKDHAIYCANQEEADIIEKAIGIKKISSSNKYRIETQYLEESSIRGCIAFYGICSLSHSNNIIPVKEALSLLGEDMKVATSITQEELNKLTEINTVWGKFPVMRCSSVSEDYCVNDENAYIVIFQSKDRYVAVIEDSEFLSGLDAFGMTLFKYAVPNTPKSERMIQIEKLEKELEKLKGMEE